MPSVVIDTNVLIRALLSPDGNDALVLRLAFNKKINLLYSNGILIELLRVLKYPRMKKFGVAEEEIDAFIRAIIRHGREIVPKEVHICRDPDDNEILGIALAVAEGGSDPVYLVSADEDILALAGTVPAVKIMTPQKFLKDFI